MRQVAQADRAAARKPADQRFDRHRQLGDPPIRVVPHAARPEHRHRVEEESYVFFLTQRQKYRPRPPATTSATGWTPHAA